MNTPPIDDSPVKQAIQAAGGVEHVAAHFDINKVSVYEWITKGRIPSERAPIVAQLARAKGTVFSLKDLCPPVPWDVAAAHMAASASA